MSTTTKGATAVPINGEPSECQSRPPMKCRRKMRKICCCLTFLLIFNFFLTMYIAHKICRIMHIVGDDDMIIMPGGEKSFCNDFCVDLCINGEDFQCDIYSCLNGCTQHFDIPPPPPPETSQQQNSQPPPPEDIDTVAYYDDTDVGVDLYMDDTAVYDTDVGVEEYDDPQMDDLDNGRP